MMLARRHLSGLWPTAVATALFAACGSITAGGGNAPDLRGSWSYVGQQVAPALTLSGTLVISGQTGGTFNGNLQVIETDLAGVQRQRAGVVSGTASAATIDFDAFLDATSRRHVGRIAGDSVSGSWIGDAASDVPLAGTFRLHRMTRP